MIFIFLFLLLAMMFDGEVIEAAVLAMLIYFFVSLIW